MLGSSTTLICESMMMRPKKKKIKHQKGILFPWDRVWVTFCFVVFLLLILISLPIMRCIFCVRIDSISHIQYVWRFIIELLFFFYPKNIFSFLFSLFTLSFRIFVMNEIEISFQFLVENDELKWNDRVFKSNKQEYWATLLFWIFTRMHDFSVFSVFSPFLFLPFFFFRLPHLSFSLPFCRFDWYGNSFNVNWFDASWNDRKVYCNWAY